MKLSVTSLLKRFWSAIVGAVAAASIGLVVAIICVISQFSLDVALTAVLILTILGGVAGFALARHKS